MKAFLAVIARDMKLATRAGGDTPVVVLFYLLVGAVMPFAVGPEKVLLAKLGPAIIWVSALLSLLLSLDRLFRNDLEDGSLMAMIHAPMPLEMLVFAKLAAHWLAQALPLIAATPLLAILLGLDATRAVETMLTLVVGTPALVCFGAIGAAVTVTIRRGGLIAPILILPLSVPTLIFGVSALSSDVIASASVTAFLFLAAITLLSLVFTPFATSIALRTSVG